MTTLLTVSRRINVSDDNGYMLVGDLMEHFGCSRMWITRKLADSDHPFPKPIKFGGATSARRWRRADVLEWERQKIERAEILEQERQKIERAKVLKRERRKIERDKVLERDPMIRPTFLSARDLRARYGVFNAWIARKLKDTELTPPFPRPIKSSGATAARYWRLSEIEAWEIARAKRP